MSRATPVVVLALFSCTNPLYEVEIAPEEPCLGDVVEVTVFTSSKQRPRVKDVHQGTNEASVEYVGTDGETAFTFEMVCGRDTMELSITDGEESSVHQIPCKPCNGTETTQTTETTYTTSTGSSGPPECDPPSGTTAAHWGAESGPTSLDPACGSDPASFQDGCAAVNDFGTVVICGESSTTEVASGSLEPFALSVSAAAAAIAVWNWDTQSTEVLEWSGADYASTPLPVRNAELSENGQHVVGTDVASGELVIHSASTGARSQFTRSVVLDGSGIFFDATPTRDGGEVLLVHDGDLVPEDTNGQLDLYAIDVATGAPTLLSPDATGQAIGFYPTVALTDITPDGRCAAFHTRDDLDPADTWGEDDVFLVDRDPDGNGVFDSSPAIEPISVKDGTGAYMNHYGADDGRVSDDCRYVVFDADTLITEDFSATSANGVRQAYVRDRMTGSTAIASVSAAGLPGNDESFRPQISRDNTAILFVSTATDLAGGDGSWILHVAPNPLAP